MLTVKPQVLWPHREEGSADPVSTFTNRATGVLFQLLSSYFCDTESAPTPNRGHKIQQEMKQLICEVVMAQGHKLVPLLGGFILVLSLSKLPFPT